jgi:CheY-like chemotaxis protein
VPLPAAADAQPTGFMPPDLVGQHVLIIAPGTIEAELLARRLARWAARACVVPDCALAGALLPERAWDTVLVDHALGRDACATLARATSGIPRRIVLVKPAARHELPALKELGFTGYLVKPVRAASLAARLDAQDHGFERPDEKPTTPADVASRTGGLSILVAEDNEINALLARSLLTRLGHRPTIATTGAEATETWLAARAAGTPYDLVLMDVHMPGIDGIEATRRIRAAEAAGDRRMPIIAITANAFDEDRDACLAAGMDGFLTKPLDRERLAAALASIDAAALAA